MRIYKTKNYDEMSRKAANIISAQIILKPESVLGLATGSSPIGTYKQLIEWYNKGDLDFSQIRSINLDEYKGLPADNDQSYAYFMRHNLFDHVNIKSVNTFIPNGMEAPTTMPSSAAWAASTYSSLASATTDISVLTSHRIPLQRKPTAST